MNLELPFAQVDAFTNEPFRGNSAAVLLLENWLPDEQLQGIAMENNLSETAFLVPTPEGQGDDYRLRWFTPTVEVDFCGHATLAAAHWLFEIGRAEKRVTFDARIGTLSVEQDDDGWLWLDGPSLPGESVPVGDSVRELIAGPILAVRESNYTMVAVEKESQVRNFQPDFNRIAHRFPNALILTAPGDEVDFVSRFFAPTHGVDEDPVTGSAHAILTPFWAEHLGKGNIEMSARQLSQRVGVLRCQALGDRVRIGGQAVTIIVGVFRI